MTGAKIKADELSAELRELLYASIEFRHAKAFARTWLDASDDDDVMPRHVADPVARASNRLIDASWQAERIYGPDAIKAGTPT